MLHGIDISNYQRGLRIADIQADFVIVKASEGVGYADPSAKDLAHQTLQSGRRLGMYHFAHPGKNTAQAEAEWFLKIIQPYIGKAILALDWEADTISDTAWAKEWLDIVYQKSGVRPWIYMSESVANRYDWTDVAKDYRLWMAQYVSQLSSKRYGGPHAVWQCASDGQVDGIRGRVDVNIAYENLYNCDEKYVTPPEWTVTMEFEPTEDTVESTADHLGLRLSPDAALPNRYATGSKGQRFRRTGVNAENGWSRLVLEDGTVVYASNDYLTLPSTDSSGENPPDNP